MSLVFVLIYFVLIFPAVYLERAVHVAPASILTELAHHEIALYNARTADRSLKIVTCLTANHAEAFFLWVQLLRETGVLLQKKDILNDLLAALASMQRVDPSTLIGIAEMLVEIDGNHFELAKRIVLRVASDSYPPATVYAAIFDFRRSNRCDVAAAELVKPPWPWPCFHTRSSSWHASGVYGLGYHYAQLGDDIATIAAGATFMCGEHRERLGVMAAWLRRHRQVPMPTTSTVNLLNSTVNLLNYLSFY